MKITTINLHASMSSENLFYTYSDYNHANPLGSAQLSAAYELLFCDNSQLYKNEMTIPHYPWDILMKRESDPDKILKIYQNKELETRPRIVACSLLNAMGVKVDNSELLGMVIEIHHKVGLDVLAVYNDGTARYINSNHQLIIWETNTERSTELLDKLFSLGNMALQGRQPLFVERGNLPLLGRIRFSYLTSQGIKMDEGSLQEVHSQSSLDFILQKGIEFMNYLTRQQRFSSTTGRKNVFS